MRRVIAVALLVMSSAVAFAQADGEWYLGKPIKDIRFAGLIAVASEDLAPLIKEYKGKTFTDELWSELLARVYELDYFDEIVPEAVPSDAANSSVIIRFAVKEKPSVSSITIAGNSGVRTAEIQEILTTVADAIFVESQMRLDEMAIRRLYQGKGFPDAKVKSESRIGKSGVEVVFSIEEGIQNLVERIAFEGVSAVSPSTLKSEIELKEKGIFQSGHFSESGLEESRRAIERYYGKRGYVDAAVTDVRRESTPSPKGDASRLALTFVVDEGRSYTYDGMEFDGNTLFSDEQLSALTRQQKGSTLNVDKLVQDQGRAADLYFENGYIFNGFRLSEKRDEEAGSIAFTLVIEEKPQARIEDVIFKGNVKTKEFVLRRLVPLESGDVFSKTKIMEALRSLYNTQFFSAITPEYEQGSKDLFVDLVISVEEQSTASIQFGLTYTPSASAGSFPIIGLVNWSDINFLGNGQKVALETNLAIASQDLSFSFSDDWLFGRRISGMVEFAFAHEALDARQDSSGVIFDYGNPLRAPDPYDSYEEWAAAGFDVPDDYLMSYDTWTFSLEYSAGYRFVTPVGTLGLIPGIVHELEMKTYDQDLYRPYDESIAENLDTWLLSNSIYGRVYLNDLDIWYDPSKGYYGSQRLTLTGWFPGELNHFIRSDTRLDGFLTLLNVPVGESWALKAILGAHSKLSILVPYPGRDEVEAEDSKLLAIDGTFVGRGWSTLASYYGTSLWDNWLELRVPAFPGVLAVDGFLSAALVSTEYGLLDVARTVSSGSAAYDADAGTFGFDLGNVAFSAGFGLRFLILQFPFRIYLAKRFVFDDADGFKAASDQWDFVLSVTTSLD